MSSNTSSVVHTVEELSQNDYSIKELFKNDPEWLQRLRSSAWELFSKIPIEADPNMLKFLQPGKLEKAIVNFPPQYSDSKKTSIESVSSEGKFTKFVINKGSIKVLQNGNEDVLDKVNIVSISEGLIEKEKELEKLLPEAYSIKQIDKLTLLSLATFTWGSFTEVKQNTILEEPILLLFPGEQRSETGLEPSLHFINVKKNSDVTFLLEQRSEENAWNFENIVFNVEEGSHVKILNILNHNKKNTSISSNLVHIHQNSTVNYISANLGSNYSRIRNEFRLRGSGAEVKEIEILRGQSNQFFDVFSAIQHEAAQTQGQTYARGVLSDKSTAIFKGMVDVPSDIPKCNSYLALHGLLMDKTARFHTIPAMEIANSDIKAAHAATVSQIDDEKIFYFESRGVKKEIARKLISEGYIQPAVQEFPNKKLQNSFLQIIRKYWYENGNQRTEGTTSEWELVENENNDN
ncbi:MAG: SufD family Fe-S cluster assembly protein [Candidatus Hodarchaeales archaeon]|jgi:Fe-S cluster assembly protein SufD